LERNRDSIVDRLRGLVESALAWAVWAAGVLEACGHRTVLERWLAAQLSLTDVVQTALESADRVVVLISDRLLFQLDLYGAREPETLRELVADQGSRVVLVEVGEDELSDTAGDFESVSLRPLDRDAAIRALLVHLGIQASPAHMPAGFPDDPLPIWSGVPLRNPRITGREELLDELRQVLLRNEVHPGVCTLLGGPGMGKTQVVTEYVHRWRSEYDGVWWIDADVVPGKVANRVTRVLAEAQRVPEHRCLIVLDGWDAMENAVEVLSRTGYKHVVITSRNEDWAEHVPVLRVGPLRGDARPVGEELLRKALVRVEKWDGRPGVSGFFVAPGWALTSTGTDWGAEPGAGVATYDGRRLRIERVHRSGDLELLRVPDALEEHCVWLSDQPFPSPGEVLVQAAGPVRQEGSSTVSELVGLEGSSLRLGGASLTALSEGGAVFDPRQGAVIGVVGLRPEGRGGALSVPVATIGDAPMWHEVITAHDRHHWRRYGDTHVTSWIDIQDELLRDTWQQRDFTPEWRAELYAILAELPPPTGPEQVLELTDRRKIAARLSPYAPHSWREGVGIAHHQERGLGAVALYAARVWAELPGPAQPLARLRSWVERAKETLLEDQSTRSQDITAVLERSELASAVLVEVVNPAWDPHRFELRVMVRAGGEWMPLSEQAGVPAESVQAFLAEPLNRAFRQADGLEGSAPLFWSLPRTLLNTPVENWWSSSDDVPFALDRAVAVRSLERGQVLPEHRARWAGVSHGTLQGLSLAGIRDEADLYARLTNAPAMTVPYFCWHGAQEMSPFADAAIRLGYPVMLWSRQHDDADCREFHEQVGALLEEVGWVGQLLERVRDIRVRAFAEEPTSWSRWITLFYDPPELVPPPRPLEAP
ncbi:TIR domain-containing protein, partial [Streptomyces sp. Agncl-13]|uniref:VMAP-C domain-containing protein n=1 Tax=Streptomyces sp. Agncl-13 TaxID=3400628 RepID=UPI003A83798C